MTKEKLTEAKQLENEIKIKHSLLDALKNTGFWNISITMDGHIRIFMNGDEGKGLYNFTNFFEDLTIDFVKKLRSRTEYSLRKSKSKLSKL